jgi:CheY-like chemotaxis protein
VHVPGPYAATDDTDRKRQNTMEKILIVDDDILSRQLIVRSLEKVGYVTSTTDSVSAALTLLHSDEPIALLITDIMMPDMDGLTLLSHIRQAPSLMHLPVLICTTLNSRETIIRAGHLHVAGYLLKPIDVTRLRKKVREILQALPQPLAPLSQTLRRLDLDETTYLTLVDELANKLTIGIDEITELTGQKDQTRLLAATSALYGAAKSLGAERAGNVLERILHASEKLDFTAAQALTAALRREIAQLQYTTAHIRAQQASLVAPPPADGHTA